MVLCCKPDSECVVVNLVRTHLSIQNSSTLDVRRVSTVETLHRCTVYPYHTRACDGAASNAPPCKLLQGLRGAAAAIPSSQGHTPQQAPPASLPRPDTEAAQQ